MEHRYPHITFTPCIAHGLNNLLKDIGELSWVSPIIEKGKEIMSFITRRHYILSELRKTSPKDVLKYNDTRFAYNFIMLERLKKVEHVLRQLVVSNEWINWPTSRTSAARICYSHIMHELF